MPKKCYYKPNRSIPRVFTVCDAARIAEQAREVSTSEDVVATIGRRLGYSKLVDGSKFTDKEVVEEIREIITALDIAGDLLVLIPGSVIWKAVLFVLRKFTGEFAILVAPIVLALLLKHTLKSETTCKFDLSS